VIAHTSKGYLIRFGEIGPGGGEEAAGPQSERVERLHAAFTEAGLNTRVPDDMRAELWDKFLFIVPFAGLTTLARAPIGEILAVPELAAVLDAMYREAAAVAAADGAGLADDPAGRTMANVRKLHPEFKSSMQRDLERGKPLEVDALLGAMARIGRRHGVATPVTDTVYGVLTLEDRRARGAVTT
jgi:2-dehydropantoate 2-reductase